MSPLWQYVTYTGGSLNTTAGLLPDVLQQSCGGKGLLVLVSVYSSIWLHMRCFTYTYFYLNLYWYFYSDSHDISCYFSTCCVFTLVFLFLYSVGRSCWPTCSCCPVDVPAATQQRASVPCAQSCDSEWVRRPTGCRGRRSPAHTGSPSRPGGPACPLRELQTGRNPTGWWLPGWRWPQTSWRRRWVGKLAEGHEGRRRKDGQYFMLFYNKFCLTEHHCLIRC